VEEVWYGCAPSGGNNHCTGFLSPFFEGVFPWSTRKNRFSSLGSLEIKAPSPARESCCIGGNELRESFRFWCLALMVGLSSECMFGQKQILDFRTRFTQETEAVRRAQKMLKLGEADFDEVTGDIDAVKLPDGLAVLKEYRDEIQLCEEGLDAKKIDAEKHPQGFKQLEISLRQSLRPLNSLLVGLRSDEQAPFLEVRTDLDELNRHLIHELFPR